MRAFLRHLPGDLQGQSHAVLLEHGYTFLISTSADAQPPKA
jgi:hypothetical protein